MRSHALGRVVLAVVISTTTTLLASRCSADPAETRGAALGRYELLRKSVPGALAWELIPGAGSLYAEDTRGAVLTWTGLAVGVGMVIYGFGGLAGALPDGPEPPPTPPPDAEMRVSILFAGTALGLAARIYGFVNAWHAAGRYNDALRVSLGLTPALSFAAPGAPAEGVAVALPGLAGHF